MALESSVQLALIVAIPAIVSPLLLAWINDRTQRKAKLLEAAIRRQEKLEDYARQDRVATALATNNRIVEQANRQTNIMVFKGNRFKFADAHETEKFAIFNEVRIEFIRYLYILPVVGSIIVCLENGNFFFLQCTQ